MAPPPRLLQFLAVLLFLSVVLLLLAVSGVHATRHHHADVIGGEHRVGTSYIRAPRSLAPYSVLPFNFAQVAGLQAVDRLLSPSTLHECCLDAAAGFGGPMLV